MIFYVKTFTSMQMSACRQEEKTVSGITFLTRLRKVKVQKIAANSQTYVVCFQIESYLTL